MCDHSTILGMAPCSPPKYALGCNMKIVRNEMNTTTAMIMMMTVTVVS